MSSNINQEDWERVLSQFIHANWIAKPRVELFPELDVLLDFSKNIRILEVGSGPITRIGYKSNRGAIDFQCIDIAADNYRKALDKEPSESVTMEEYMAPIQGDVYHIDNLFPGVRFDMVVAMNLLDELDNPIMALAQMKKCCASGGSIIIYNIADRGQEQSGMQNIQWKFKEIDGSIMMLRGEELISLNSQFPEDLYHISSLFDGRFFRIRVQSKGQNRPDIKPSWEEGRIETERFWRSVFTPSSKHAKEWQQRLDPNKEFNPIVLEFVKKTSGPLRVLDVGAGPCTSLGYNALNYDLELVCTDYHAELFEQILNENEIDVPVKTSFADALDLRTAYQATPFDIVHSRNALDHVLDPVIALEEMLAVTSPGGFVYLSGHTNEGESEFYHGFHQWNFVVEDGDLIIWRPFERYSVSELFDGLISEIIAQGESEYAVAIYKL